MTTTQYGVLSTDQINAVTTSCWSIIPASTINSAPNQASKLNQAQSAVVVAASSASPSLSSSVSTALSANGGQTAAAVTSPTVAIQSISNSIRFNPIMIFATFFFILFFLN